MYKIEMLASSTERFLKAVKFPYIENALRFSRKGCRAYSKRGNSKLEEMDTISRGKTFELVTDALKVCGYGPEHSLYDYFRHWVNFCGSAKDSASSLYYQIDKMHGHPVDPFIKSLVNTFEEKLDPNDENSQRLKKEVNLFRDKYKIHL